ncbi:MAG TPA: hypothetical protein VNI78_07350 [Vicinamibacterales bacterium]|nr:hypothetical protein [Vicinamibacterales bacterium]
MIDDTGADGAERHPVALCGLGAFAEDDTAGLADLLDPARPVTAATRQHDGDGAVARVLGQRREEDVDRQRQARARILVVEDEPPVADDHFLHRRQQVDRVRL